jgi:hypothetical protein
MTEHVPVAKNEDEELPVPTEWRKPLGDLVACLASGEFGKLPSVAPVTPLTDEECSNIELYIRDYGATLTTLPEESWKTSIYRWMDGFGMSSWIYSRSKQDLAAWCCLYEFIP